MVMGKSIKMAAMAGVVFMAVAGCGGADLGGAPNVQGLALPDANERLEGAGFSSSVTSDALFGVIVESNYTVCEQKTPSGQLVPLEVSKQC